MAVKHVLLIDDNEADQFLSKTIIEAFDPNIEISQAYDGEDALEFLANNPDSKIDLIFLDVNMPRMDGFGFLEAYTNIQGNHAPVIIMLSSSSQERDKQRAFSFECVHDYMLKPLDPGKLNSVREALEKLS